MIDAIHAAAAAERARLATPSTGATPGSAAAKSFAGELARFTRSATAPAASTPAATTPASGTPAATKPAATKPAEVKIVARPDNEHTTKVAGHPYARIENGRDKGMYLNQLDGNPREGAVFKLIERDDRVFHVYGKGRNMVIIEVTPKEKSDTAAPTGGTAPAAT
jgi:hypothetical protein